MRGYHERGQAIAALEGVIADSFCSLRSDVDSLQTCATHEGIVTDGSYVIGLTIIGNFFGNSDCARVGVVSLAIVGDSDRHVGG